MEKLCGKSMREMNRTEMMELYGEEGYETDGFVETIVSVSKETIKLTPKSTKVCLSIGVTMATYYITKNISRKRGQDSYANSCQAGC